MPKIKLDFTDVSDGFTLVPEGDYVGKVKSITLEDGKKAKMLVWTLVIGIGPEKGKTVRHNTSLSPAALFRLRDTIIACGCECPKSVVTINTDNYIGKVIGFSIEHTEVDRDGQKKTYANVDKVYPVTKNSSGVWVKLTDAAIDAIADAANDEEEDDDDGAVLDDEGIDI